MALISCFECGAEWPDAEALIAEHNKLIDEFRERGFETHDEWYADSEDKVWCCPRCTHDF